MPRFIFDMPDTMVALVEAHRIKRGYKATAVAVRELISTGLEVAGTLEGVVFERDASGVITFRDIKRDGEDADRFIAERQASIRQGARRALKASKP